MKKLILISALAITFMSCSKDDAKSSESANCNCGKIMEREYYQFPSHTVMTIKNDCTGELKIIDVQGCYGTIGQQWCNY
jgi:hypothetical protein